MTENSGALMRRCHAAGTGSYAARRRGSESWSWAALSSGTGWEARADRRARPFRHRLQASHASRMPIPTSAWSKLVGRAPTTSQCRNWHAMAEPPCSRRLRPLHPPNCSRRPHLPLQDFSGLWGRFIEPARRLAMGQISDRPNAWLFGIPGWRFCPREI